MVVTAAVTVLALSRQVPLGLAILLAFWPASLAGVWGLIDHERRRDPE
jgi:hypothetical protein